MDGFTPLDIIAEKLSRIKARRRREERRKNSSVFSGNGGNGGNGGDGGDGGDGLGEEGRVYIKIRSALIDAANAPTSIRSRRHARLHPAVPKDLKPAYARDRRRGRVGNATADAVQSMMMMTQNDYV